MMEMIPHSPTEFGLRFTAGLIEFETTTDGPAKNLRFEMGGSTNEATRTTQTR